MDILPIEPICTGNNLLDTVFKQLLRNSGEEIIENLTRKLAGATSPWQLLQIPVEILTYTICKLIEADETFAYGMGKLSSFVTAATVGFCVGRPLGAATSLVFWVVGEIVAWLLRKVIDELFDNRVNVKKLCIGIKNFLNSCLLAGETWVKALITAIRDSIERAGLMPTLTGITL